MRKSIVALPESTAREKAMTEKADFAIWKKKKKI